MLLRKDRGARTDKLKCVADCCFKTTQIGVEYYSENQRGGIYGPVYMQFFTTALPSDLTSGDQVSRLIDYGLSVDNGANRHIFRGYTSDGIMSTILKLSGTEGNGNLSLTAVGITIVSGWVEYTK